MTLVVVRMRMGTSTTSTLQQMRVYGIIHVMNTTETWSYGRNKNVQVLWCSDFISGLSCFCAVFYAVCNRCLMQI